MPGVNSGLKQRSAGKGIGYKQIFTAYPAIGLYFFQW